MGRNPLIYMKKLIPKPKTKFQLNEISIQQTYQIIKNMKASNLTGYNQINLKIIKDIPHFSALILTHLINSIIITGNYPRCLKVAKIIPICKPDKN